MIARSLKITGAGAVVALSSGSPALSGFTAGHQLRAKWVQITTPPTNSAQILVGGAEVTSTVGYPIPVGWSGQFLPMVSDDAEWYDLSEHNVYAANGDVVHILYGGA